LLGDNLLDCVSDDWTLLFDGLTSGSYTIFLYGPEHPAVETGNMTVNGFAVPNVPGGASSGASELVSPAAGNMLMFPSWVSHAVRPYTGDGLRISIAINLS
jgi:hypothetical protein